MTLLFMHKFKPRSQQTPYLKAFLLELKILSKIMPWREKIIVSTGARIFERSALTMAKKLGSLLPVLNNLKFQAHYGSGPWIVNRLTIRNGQQINH